MIDVVMENGKMQKKKMWECGYEWVIQGLVNVLKWMGYEN